MAARFWRWALVASLGVAVAGGLLLATAMALPAWTALLFAAAVLVGLPAAGVAVSGAIAGSAWRSLPAEIGCLVRAMLAMSAPRRPAPAPAAAPRPVMLLHGLLCNHAVWAPLAVRLVECGFGPVDAPDIEPLLADIDAQARRLAPRLRALQDRCGGARVLIVAHSMGGLVARALLRDLGAGVVRAIVTIGSPHHGSVPARHWPWPATRQMRRGSPWLRALNDAQAGHWPVPVASIFSADDNLVRPADSARLAGAGLHELRGLGHFALLRSARVHDLVVTALAAAEPA